jgi:TctA family transporter
MIEGVVDQKQLITQQPRSLHSFNDLRIPANVVMAILLGALMIHGITLTNADSRTAQSFWGLVASMYIGI